MAQPDWADLDGLDRARRQVVDALIDVVGDFGEDVTASPARLRAALADALGAESREHRAEMDALVVAAEEGVAGDLADGVDEPLVARLVARGLADPVSRWAVGAWREATEKLPLEHATVRRADLVEGADLVAATGFVEATVLRSAASTDNSTGNGMVTAPAPGASADPNALRLPEKAGPPAQGRAGQIRRRANRSLLVAAVAVVLLLLLGVLIVTSAVHGTV